MIFRTCRVGKAHPTVLTAYAGMTGIKRGSTAALLTRHPGVFLAGIRCLPYDQKTLDACTLEWRGTSYEGRGRVKGSDPFYTLGSTAVLLTRHPGVFLAGIQCLPYDQKTLDACPLEWRGTSYQGRGKDTGCLPAQA